MKKISKNKNASSNPVTLDDLADPWGGAFFKWFVTGDKTEICRLLIDGEPFSHNELFVSSRDNRKLLAAIISGEWPRPKTVGEITRYDDKYFQNEYARRLVARVKRMIKASATKKGIRVEANKEALELVARRYGLSSDGLDKRLRKSGNGYIKRTPQAHKQYIEARSRILAKS